VQHCRRCVSVHAVGPLQSVPAAPWSITFDLKERETEWTEENKVSARVDWPCSPGVGEGEGGGTEPNETLSSTSP
jgi:hypothetical protein